MILQKCQPPTTNWKHIYPVLTLSIICSLVGRRHFWRVARSSKIAVHVHEVLYMWSTLMSCTEHCTHCLIQWLSLITLVFLFTGSFVHNYYKETTTNCFCCSWCLILYFCISCFDYLTKLCTFLGDHNYPRWKCFDTLIVRLASCGLPFLPHKSKYKYLCNLDILLGCFNFSC